MSECAFRRRRYIIRISPTCPFLRLPCVRGANWGRAHPAHRGRRGCRNRGDSSPPTCRFPTASRHERYLNGVKVRSSRRKRPNSILHVLYYNVIPPFGGGVLRRASSRETWAGFPRIASISVALRSRRVLLFDLRLRGVESGWVGAEACPDLGAKRPTPQSFGSPVWERQHIVLHFYCVLLYYFSSVRGIAFTEPHFGVPPSPRVPI